MDKRCGILIVSVTIFVLCLVVTTSATNWTVNGSGGADFTGIQDAINNASAGDTILVHSGVYYENVVVDKSVTLKGIDHPVVDAGGRESAITLTADEITLVGFNATNSGLWSDVGIKVTSNNNTITGNNVCSNGVGIRLSSSSNNTITGNVFVNDCLFAYFSYQNIVEDNTVNGKPLVYLEDVSDYKVEDAGQVILVNCDDITVENLDLSNTSGGIALWKTENSKISNNTVCSNRGGIRLSFSSNNSITGNNVSSNNYEGIRLYDSSYNIITGNNLSNNNYDGIFLLDSSNNTITGNNVSNNSNGGIDLDYSSNNNAITGNVFVNDGLSVHSSYQNTVEDNRVNGKPLVYLEDLSDCKVEDAGQVIIVNCNNITIENLDLSNTSGGIALWKTKNSTISNNTVCNNNRGGIGLDYSSNNTITGNNVSNNNEEGISLSSSSNNNTITGNNVSNNNRGGISLFSSSNNTITGNNVSNNSNGGIDLDYSSNNNAITDNVFVNDGLSVYSSYQNTVEDNTVNGKPLVYLEDVSDYKVEDAGQVIIVNCNNITIENLDLSNTSGGIALWKTKNSTISNNTVCNNNRGGIGLDYSSNNRITGNNVSNNKEEGISLSSSSNNNTVTGNVFVNDGLFVYSSYQNTVEDNTVNGKPLVYLEDVSDYKVEDAGQVIIVNCNNITIENLDLSNRSGGIALWKTENSKISNNKICNSRGGIRLGDSSNNNTITGNNVSNNEEGISLYLSRNNSITGNNVSNNNWGIGLYYSSNNKIYFNNFINNTYNVDSLYSTNIWNSPLEITYTYDGTTYKSYLGNYWDVYEGTDADGDGTGDTHYSIDSDSDESDDYPLMKPFENYILPRSAPP